MMTACMHGQNTEITVEIDKGSTSQWIDFKVTGQNSEMTIFVDNMEGLVDKINRALKEFQEDKTKG